MSTLIKSNRPADEDLTTDALPDQPRDVIKNKISIDNTNDKDAATYETSIQVASNRTPPSAPTESEPSNSTKDKKKKSTCKDDTKSIPQAQGAKIVYNIKKSTGVHIGNNVVFGLQCGPNSSRTSTSTPVKETKEIKKLLQSTEPITVDDIEIVSSHVGTNWMDVGRRLKYTDGQLEQFYEDNSRQGLKEVVYRMLLDWKQVNTSKATVGILCNALWSSKQHDAVQVLEKKTNVKKP